MLNFCGRNFFIPVHFLKAKPIRTFKKMKILFKIPIWWAEKELIQLNVLFTPLSTYLLWLRLRTRIDLAFSSSIGISFILLWLKSWGEKKNINQFGSWHMLRVLWENLTKTGVIFQSLFIACISTFITDRI